MAECEAESKVYSAAIGEAAGILAAARSLPGLRQREAEAEVTARHATFLNPRARRDLSQATDERQRAEARVADGLSRAGEAVRSLRLEHATDEQKAAGLVQLVRDRAELASAKLEVTRDRLDELELASRVVAKTVLPMRGIPEHRPATRVVGKSSGARAAQRLGADAERRRAYAASMAAAKAAATKAEREFDRAMGQGMAFEAAASTSRSAWARGARTASSYDVREGEKR